MFYKSLRVGKNGKVFEMYKFRTLENGSGKMFAGDSTYTRHGRFLRKFKLDELPQLVNVLKGEMKIFGYRPEEKRTFDIIPPHVKDTFLKEKPGIIDMASIYFWNEEEILSLSKDKQYDYWSKIKPIKFVLQMFYIENRSFFLNVAILWMLLKKIVKTLWAR